MAVNCDQNGKIGIKFTGTGTQMSFWGELKRRNVFRVGLAYLAAAWLLMQVADLILTNFNAPTWVIQALILSASLGFPLALLVAWFYELTPEGIKPAADLEDVGEVHFTGRRIDFVIIGLLVLAIGFLLLRPSGNDADVDLSKSVAVLPFSNLSPDEDDAYFAAGLHEEIMSQLAKLSGLSVIARSSVMQYENSDLSIGEIARELSVQSVMEGSVRYAGNRIRVTMQLVDPESGSSLWSETYDREFNDIFAIETNIATSVANALSVEFSMEEQRALERIPTESAEAYALYLQAHVDPDISSAAANALLDQALAIDPQFADAYARKAVWFSNSLTDSVLGDAETEWDAAHRELNALANRALSIDPDSADAYYALSIGHMLTWRWSEAQATLDRALDLKEGSPSDLGTVVWLKSFVDDHEDAIDLAERLVKLAPRNPIVAGQVCVVYIFAGNFDSAIDWCRQAIDLDATNYLGHIYLGFALAAIGRDSEAENEFRFLEQILGRDPPASLTRGIAVGYARIGLDEDAARIANNVLATAELQPVGTGTLAMAYLALRDTDQLAEQLEIARQKAERREPDPGFYALMVLKHNVIRDPILDEPAIAGIRRSIGFVD